eukprot:gnl/TRDRNA2_/TRDRNA2_135186_c0_seq1.p1 gnl/TRDRNA2_/TRDRNA2_135186_c0~~gnl/TRDRNA2_/TRDRNA2_135186_c0_seq1.p1  ORF type:complete len:539 (+),score=81.64 gnl/TRDRNA2_/TRDRNA2_135186_c0_seq1:47-1618(+)
MATRVLFVFLLATSGTSGNRLEPEDHIELGTEPHQHHHDKQEMHKSTENTLHVCMVTDPQMGMENLFQAGKWKDGVLEARAARVDHDWKVAVDGMIHHAESCDIGAGLGDYVDMWPGEKTPVINPEERRAQWHRVGPQFKRLKEAFDEKGIPFVTLTGNHETSDFVTDEYKEALVEEFQDELGIRSLSEFSDGGSYMEIKSHIVVPIIFSNALQAYSAKATPEEREPAKDWADREPAEELGTEWKIIREQIMQNLKNGFARAKATSFPLVVLTHIPPFTAEGHMDPSKIEAEKITAGTVGKKGEKDPSKIIGKKMAWGIWDWQARTQLIDLLEEFKEVPVYFLTGHLHSNIVSHYEQATVVVSTSATMPIAYKVEGEMAPATSEKVMTTDAFGGFVLNAGVPVQKKFEGSTDEAMQAKKDELVLAEDEKLPPDAPFFMHKFKNAWDGEFEGMAKLPRGMLSHSDNSGVWTRAVLGNHKQELEMYYGSVQAKDLLELTEDSTDKPLTELYGTPEYINENSIFAD